MKSILKMLILNGDSILYMFIVIHFKLKVALGIQA